MSMITNLGLDRIEDVKKSLRPFHEDAAFDPEQYFGDVIGISRDADVTKTKIIFKAYGNQKNYIDTKPIHSSQFVREMTEEYGVFEIEVVPNYELMSKLLGFGEMEEVLEPEAD